MRKPVIALIGVVCSAAMLLTACGDGNANINTQNSTAVEYSTTPQEKTVTDEKGREYTIPQSAFDSSFDESSATKITLSGNSADVSGGGAEFQNGVLSVSKGGVYVLSGTAENIITRVDAKGEKVRIVLDNVNINNTNTPAIYGKQADKLYIILKDGTSNSLSDGSSYSYTDGTDDIDAAIFSKADLIINGGGSLELNGNNKHGIVSKDDLILTCGTLSVTAANVGLCGKDCVKSAAENISVTSGTDAVRSDNDEDEKRGFVYVESGSLKLTAGSDGIQSETVTRIDGGTLDIKTGSGSGTKLTSDDDTAKGLKSADTIEINGGKINIDSSDDCIHSNNIVKITNGELSLQSGDDGVHSDTELEISGGIIDVSKSYEGIESLNVKLSGGKISVKASDDGINAAGGNDSSAMGRPGENPFSEGNATIEISGGYILVDANGDGIDANGSISMSGGVTLVSGPTNNGDGALDYDRDFSVSGGTLIALGSQGMAQGISNAENQGAFMCAFDTQNGGQSFAVTDESGKVIASFTPAKAYQCAVVTSPSVTESGAYTLTAGATIENADENGYTDNGTLSGGNTLTTVTVTGAVTNSGGMGGDPRGGMGGDPRGGMGGDPRNGGDRPDDKGGMGGRGGTPPDNQGGTPPDNQGDTPPDFNGGTPPDNQGGEPPRRN